MALDNGRQKIAAVNRLGLHYSAFAKSTGLEPSRINHLAKQKSAKPEKSSLNRPRACLQLRDSQISH